METISKSKLKRVPVIYNGETLMPTTQGRAYHLMKLGKAMFVKDKHLGWYLRLKVKPKKIYKQKIALGIDTGTIFLGFSIVGKDISFNLEFEQSQRYWNRNYIKNKSNSRSTNRRTKRARLCHREARFNNRTGHKVTSTANYIYQNIRNCVNWLNKLYPISDIAVEDVKYNHYISNLGAGFSPIEQIKTRLYKFLETKGNLIISNNNPKKLRIFTDIETGELIDLKESNKSKKSFYAHCIDSHSLSQLIFNKRMPFVENVRYLYRSNIGSDSNRRILYKFKAVQGWEWRRKSKLKKIRVKIDQFQGNHGPWNYLYTEPSKTWSCSTFLYGGSIWLSTRRGHSEGQNKYKLNKGIYKYYEVQNFKTSKISSTLSYCSSN